MLIGYARVSTIHQSLDRQLGCLRAAGCKTIHAEKGVGQRREGTTDRDTGIKLHYRFEHLAGGRLHLSGGLLRDQMLSVGCDAHPDDINMVSTIMLDGLKVQLR